MSSYAKSSGRSYGSYGGGQPQGGSDPGSRPSGGAHGGSDGHRSSSAGIRAHASASRQSRAAPASRYQRQAGNDVDDDEELDMIKGQITRAKMDTLESTRNSLRTLEQTDKVATATLTKLGQQTEQILNIDRKMEQTSITAQDSVAETSRLRTLNKSIFHFNVNNPFTKGKRREAEAAKNEERRQRELQINERRIKGVQASQRRTDTLTGANGPRVTRPAGCMDASGRIVSTGGPGSSERSRYALEDEDPEIEDEIDSNMKDISRAVGRLKDMSLATRAEIKAQERPLQRIVDNADKTSAHVGLASFHLNKIK
ncbi:Protein transport protein S9 plasma membrane t-SNARE [Coemansia helicoidea]|uniref:Protein transport protein S9 plasma membrane t-SNARE n=1 Tax=Coemansia helicoidea TaxID=1286919 RepID=A0ACC1L372_9FUNG|nr:Protein transport protein S9 plasma membrane t-SNARE [Coemansia helicoidea]